jgi:hypothetical protein
MLIGALTSGIMGELSVPLMVVNLGFALLLYLTHFSRWFFWSGIVGLLVCALLNGLALNGQITLTYSLLAGYYLPWRSVLYMFALFNNQRKKTTKTKIVLVVFYCA